MNSKMNYWVVIPAAGVGKRMLVNHPKQYLKLGSKTVIEHSINCFSQNPEIKGIVVVISKDDEYWSDLHIKSQVPLFVTEGGSERCFSVFNGLKFLQTQAEENDWVLVHDAARPCLHVNDIQNLFTELKQHSVGGLLGLPVADTLKFCGENLRVKRTVSRQNLWRALTPQMFRFKKLYDALAVAVKQPDKITDEASAMEMAGFEPVMVEGRWDNIKITHPQDLAQAQLILKSHRN